MFVRLALESDMGVLAELARSNVAETRPDMEFDDFKAEATFYRYLDTADPTMWVVEHQRRVIAFLVAGMYEYRVAKGFYTVQEVLYVDRDHRGSRAALLLMKELIAWSKRLGASEIIGGNDNNFNSDRTAKFLGHFGFEKVGYSMRLLLDGR